MVNSSDFIERLELLLHYYELNASAFADKIQVQRSNISHLMSGRNKPSLEFVLKVVKQFPEVNLYWLLNGKGTFPAEDVSVQRDTSPKNQTPSNTAFQREESGSFEESASSFGSAGADQTSSTTAFGVEETRALPEYHTANSNQKKEPSENPEKVIDRIVIFYSNGSFESFSHR